MIGFAIFLEVLLPVMQLVYDGMVFVNIHYRGRVSRGKRNIRVWYLL